MNEAPFRIVRLGPGYDRAPFDCGSDSLNRYLREQVTQDVRRLVTFCFIALGDGNRIAGFYGGPTCQDKICAFLKHKL